MNPSSKGVEVLQSYLTLKPEEKDIIGGTLLFSHLWSKYPREGFEEILKRFQSGERR